MLFISNCRKRCRDSNYCVIVCVAKQQRVDSRGERFDAHHMSGRRIAQSFTAWYTTSVPQTVTVMILRDKLKTVCAS